MTSPYRWGINQKVTEWDTGRRKAKSLEIHGRPLMEISSLLGTIFLKQMNESRGKDAGHHKPLHLR